MFEVNKLQQCICAEEITDQMKSIVSVLDNLDHILLEMQSLSGMQHELECLRLSRNRITQHYNQYIKLGEELDTVCDIYRTYEKIVIAECEKVLTASSNSQIL